MAFSNLVLIRVDVCSQLLISQGVLAGRETLGVSLNTSAAHRASAVRTRAEAIAAGCKVAKSLADATGRAIIVRRVAANAAAAGASGVDVAATLACLGS